MEIDQKKKALGDSAYMLWKGCVNSFGEADEKTLNMLLTAVKDYWEAGLTGNVLDLGAKGYNTSAEKYGECNIYSAGFVYYLTEALFELKAYDDALRHGKQAYKLCVQLYGERNTNTTVMLQRTAEIYEIKGDLEEALRIREYNYPFMKEAWGAKHEKTTEALALINSLKRRLGKDTQKSGLFGLFKKNK